MRSVWTDLKGFVRQLFNRNLSSRPPSSHESSAEFEIERERYRGQRGGGSGFGGG